MPVEIDPVEMWGLSEDGTRICLDLPPLQVEEAEAPVRVRMRFDAATIDGVLERLLLLRRRMLAP